MSTNHNQQYRLASVRRFFASVLHMAAKLADAHPMVISVSPSQAHTHERHS